MGVPVKSGREVLVLMEMFCILTVSIVTWCYSFARCYYLEKAMAPHYSTLAWKIPWTEEPGRLQSMGFRRVGHD